MKPKHSNLTFLLFFTGICVVTLISLIKNIEQNVRYMQNIEGDATTLSTLIDFLN
jgi:hypothetical protein